MAPHFGGDRPKGVISCGVLPLPTYQRQQDINAKNNGGASVLRFGMAGGSRVRDTPSSGRTPRLAFEGQTKEADQNCLQISQQVSSVEETFWMSSAEISEGVSNGVNLNSNNCELSNDRIFNTLRKESVRTVVVNGVKNMEDMGEIAKILNDSSSDGLISSECERNLREKYGLHFEHTLLRNDSKLSDLPLKNDESFYGNHTLANETGTIYGSGLTCGGGAMVRYKFGQMVRRYTDYVQATSFVRHVVDRAKKPKRKRRRCLQATKVGPSPSFATPIKCGLTVIPANVETVGEAMLRLCSPPVTSVSPPDCTHGTEFNALKTKLGLDLGNGEFEKRMSSFVAVSRRESVHYREEEHKHLMSHQVLRQPLDNLNSNISRPVMRGNRPVIRGNNRSSMIAADRPYSCTEEGASTSWLLVLYSPEFAPKNVKGKRLVVQHSSPSNTVKYITHLINYPFL